MPYKDLVKRREYNNAYTKEWAKRNPEKRAATRRRAYERYGELIREKARQKSKEYTLELRPQVITAYGGKCDCCSESRAEFLTIDHKNGRNQEEKADRGPWFYRRIIKAGFPPHLRLLCWNCNCGRRFTPNNVCPHQC